MKSSLHVARQMAFYTFGLLLMKGISLFMLPVITRYLSPDEYGVLDVLLTWMNVLGIVLGFGFTDVLYRFAQPHTDAKRVYQTLLQLQCWGLLPIIVVLAVGLQLSQFWLPASLQNTLPLFALGTAALANALMLPLCWLRLQEKADWFFYCSAGKALLQAALCWWFLAQGYGVVGVFYASVLSHAVILLILRAEFAPCWQRPRWDDQYRRYFQYGLPLVVSGLCLFLVCGAERWIIAGILTARDLAHYAIASQFALMVAVCVEPFTLWWFPKRLSMLQQPAGQRRVAQTAVLGCLLSMMAATGIGAVGPWLIDYLLPESYQHAALLLPWLCLAMAFKQCSHLLNTGCYSGDSTRQVSQINAMFAIIAPITYAIATWTAGLTGLLVALNLVYIGRLICFYRVSQALLPLPYPLPSLMLALAMTTLLLTVAPTLPWRGAVISAGLVTLCCAVLAYPLLQSNNGPTTESYL